jgi:hypothetical protein
MKDTIIYREAITLQRSPSGSICPYYYLGGEIHPLEYGGYHEDKQHLFEIMRMEEAYIFKSPGTNNRRIWIDLYETKLDSETIQALVKHIISIQTKIYKVCLVGCSPLACIRIKRVLAKENLTVCKITRFFTDPEKAKQWLVLER